MRESMKEIMAGVEFDKQPRPKLVANNTVLYYRGGERVIRLHHTDIQVLKKDGTYVFNTGGWKTLTTKDRIGYDTGLRFSTEKRVWYVSHTTAERTERVLFKDGMMWHPARGFVNCGEAPDPKLIKEIKRYAKAFADALPVDMPSNGDCWGCLMHDVDGKVDMPFGTDHLLEHMREDDFVPSLMLRVLKENGIEPGKHAGAAWGASAFKQPGEPDDPFRLLEGRGRQRFTRWIYNYLYVRLVDGRK